MKAVRLTRAIWLNDRVHGDANDVLNLEDEEARELVETWHNAVYAPEWDRSERNAAAVRPVPQPAPEVVTIEPTAVSDSDIDDRGPVLEADIPGETVQDDAKPPWSNAPKADWVAWAVHKGCKPGEAAGMTKNQLMSRYGERL